MACSPFFGLVAPPVTQTALEKHGDYIERVMREEIELESNPVVYQEIFEYFQEDMPIGVQKYRTGDADQWIFSRLDALSSVPY